MPSRYQRLFGLLQHCLPHHLLSRGMERITRCRSRWVKDPLIRWFSARYRIDLEEARFRSPGAYPDFNGFFTRELRPGARPGPGHTAAVASPVDAVVSHRGEADGATLFQAKGRVFDLLELLGGDPLRAAPFRGGSFATLYLSPRDYHRIHMPCDGELLEMVHVPGRLFSVNEATSAVVDRLYARNERVAALFRTTWGPMAVVMVGALFVGSIETAWHGVVTPPRSRTVRLWKYEPGQIRLGRGEELGRFNMGSTVILLFGAGRVAWDPGAAPGARVLVGREIARGLEGRELGPAGA